MKQSKFTHRNTDLVRINAIGLCMKTLTISIFTFVLIAWTSKLTEPSISAFTRSQTSGRREKSKLRKVGSAKKESSSRSLSRSTIKARKFLSCRTKSAPKSGAQSRQKHATSRDELVKCQLNGQPRKWLRRSSTWQIPGRRCTPSSQSKASGSNKKAAAVSYGSVTLLSNYRRRGDSAR